MDALLVPRIKSCIQYCSVIYYSITLKDSISEIPLQRTRHQNICVRQRMVMEAIYVYCNHLINVGLINGGNEYVMEGATRVKSGAIVSAVRM